MKVSSENLKGGDHLGDLCVGGRKIFKFNFKEQDVWVWSGIS
jgi:hypothetical protein